jgi:hypothetical protein
MKCASDASGVIAATCMGHHTPKLDALSRMEVPAELNQLGAFE